MAVFPPVPEIRPAVPAPRFLVELPSPPRIFFSNFRDLLLPRRLPPLDLRSAPASFWPDVFVHRPLPWRRFLESAGYHVVGVALLIGLTQFFAIQPRVVSKPAFDRSQVIYYRASEFLPPLDTRTSGDATPRKAEPEFSRQPVISVPRQADNRSQTVVTPPQLNLNRDVALPNIVSWADKSAKPRLAIPSAPVSPAAEITRLAPAMRSPVAAPPQDPTRMATRRASPGLQDQVAAPPSDLRSTSSAPIPSLQPALAAPPSDVASSPSRRIGDLNIAQSNVVAPVPQLAVSPQRTTPAGGVASLGALQIAPPPSSLSASGGAAGSPGRMIALNLHPAVDAPPDPSAGNRRGTLSATAEGHSGAPGTPGSASGTSTGSTSGTGHGNGGGGSSTSKGSDAPAGLYVGNAPKTSPIAGDPVASASPPSANVPVIASVHPSRVTTAHPLQPDSAAKLSEPERAVFGGKRFYSVTLNMPNLNSAGGSWVIRFTELKHDSPSHNTNDSPTDLSQPMATRKVDPAYPMQLMKENVHGTVILYAVIHADGTVGDIRILRGVDDRLDRFASEAVAQWKFDPATKNGTPVDVEATFQIPFKPARLGSNF